MNLILNENKHNFELTRPSRTILDKDKYQQIWNDLNFELYKIYWLEKVELQLQNQHTFIECVSQYFIEKMMIILSQELIDQIQQQQMINNQEEWIQFIEESQEDLQQIINCLQQNIIKMKQKIQNNSYQQVEEYIKQSNLDNQDNQLYNKIKLNITQDIQEQCHQDIKIPFRIVLHTFYQNVKQQPKLQLLIICCLSINQVFGKYRNITMTKILEFHKINSLDSPILIEQFLEKAQIIDIQQQTTIIDKFYF